ncbi:SDR family oxidoreductase [Schlesneria paludicola]|uniref:SDR family oxidoreductase n=1 Tax=Schlesneria paludicola TaxID=360056 RepID=UPI000299E13B|nr:SDR family oxidoreductase [Schlesneria paludicola]
MRILVLGCGYVGRRAAATWVADGHEVFALTRSEQNAKSFLEAAIRPILGDVCDPGSLRDLPAIDLTLHSIGFDRSSGKTQEDVTCGGLRHVLNHLPNSCGRFIQISSTSVYGQSDGEWVDENATCEPIQPGGQLALTAENLLHETFSARGHGRVVVLRLAGIYGPDRLLSRVNALREGLVLSGRGDSWLNLIHVDDAVTAIRAVATQELESIHNVYNVVDDEPITRRDYFECLARLVEAPTPRFDPAQPSARGSGGLNKRCSNRRLREEFNWNPAYPTMGVGLPAALKASIE